MNITLLTVGKPKDSFFQEAEKHYEKLLIPFCQYQHINIKDEILKKNASKESVLRKEETRIMNILRPQKKTIVLDEKGKQFSSQDFAQWLGSYDERGESLQFLIGGAWGLSESIKNQAHESIALSSLTLPHQLARTVFLEQLYRGFTILKGKKYHY